MIRERLEEQSRHPVEFAYGLQAIIGGQDTPEAMAALRLVAETIARARIWLEGQQTKKG